MSAKVIHKGPTESWGIADLPGRKIVAVEYLEDDEIVLHLSSKLKVKFQGRDEIRMVFVTEELKPVPVEHVIERGHHGRTS